MKIRSVLRNNRKSSFEVRTATKTFQFPYSRCDPQPTKDDPIDRVYVDKELGREGFTFALDSGREGTIHMDQVLEYNQDPMHMRDLLLYKLTIEAQKRLAASALSRREIIRRIGTSAAQFYRLIDQTNYRKSIDQLLALLQILDCDIELVVRTRRPSGEQAA